jgi:predicted permease
MNPIFKQFLIIVGSFLVILWFQYQDDKKNKLIRKTLYEQYKFPTLVASIIGLILNLNDFVQNTTEVKNVAEIAILTHTPTAMSMPFIPSNNFGSNANQQNIGWFTKKNISDQQIYTEMPDF